MHVIYLIDIKSYQFVMYVLFYRLYGDPRLYRVHRYCNERLVRFLITDTARFDGEPLKKSRVTIKNVCVHSVFN